MPDDGTCFRRNETRKRWKTRSLARPPRVLFPSLIPVRPFFALSPPGARHWENGVYFHTPGWGREDATRRGPDSAARPGHSQIPRKQNKQRLSRQTFSLRARPCSGRSLSCPCEIPFSSSRIDPWPFNDGWFIPLDTLPLVFISANRLLHSPIPLTNPYCFILLTFCFVMLTKRRPFSVKSSAVDSPRACVACP